MIFKQSGHHCAGKISPLIAECLEIFFLMKYNLLHLKFFRCGLFSNENKKSKLSLDLSEISLSENHCPNFNNPKFVVLGVLLNCT